MQVDDIHDEQDLCSFLAGMQGDRSPSASKELLFALVRKARDIMKEQDDNGT